MLRRVMDYCNLRGLTINNYKTSANLVYVGRQVENRASIWLKGSREFVDGEMSSATEDPNQNFPCESSVIRMR
jgi:hypothetical protein